MSISRKIYYSKNLKLFRLYNIVVGNFIIIILSSNAMHFLHLVVLNFIKILEL